MSTAPAGGLHLSTSAFFDDVMRRMACYYYYCGG